MSSTLSLKKKDPTEKIAQSLQLGFRFVDRKGRYILQRLEGVRYENRVVMRNFGDSEISVVERVAVESTWVDIPLCPEVYGK